MGFDGLERDSELTVLRYIETQDPGLKDLVIVEYAGLVERIARKFAGIEPVDDLVQVGYIGLLNALGKYDPNAGVRFNTYATYLVAGEIKHYLRDRSQTIRQPAWLQELRHRVNKASVALLASLGRTPTAREIADALGVSEASVEDVIATADILKVGSLDTVSDEDDGDTEMERLDAADFSQEQLSVEDRLLLESAIRQLRDLERQVLIHFHFDSMNQTEIANKLGISCNYVSHILRQSLAKLRKILSSEEQKDSLLRSVDAADQATIDPTTGIYNELYFRSRLAEEMHRASSETGILSVMILEFEGLDTLQSYYGRESVQDFLADAADVVKDSIRRLDIVCRYGEHGFGVILPATGANAGLVQQRLITKVDQWLKSRRPALGAVTQLAGMATMGARVGSVDEFIAMAIPSGPCDESQEAA